ncbi:hypothetical protein RUND412_002929, partial [Rhizina undulata]
MVVGRVLVGRKVRTRASMRRTKIKVRGGDQSRKLGGVLLQIFLRSACGSYS